jgi:hypothetical protein
MDLRGRMGPRRRHDFRHGVGLQTIAGRCGEEKRHEIEIEKESASEGCLRNRGPSVSHSDLCMQKNEGQGRGQVGHCLCLSGILLSRRQNTEEDIEIETLYLVVCFASRAMIPVHSQTILSALAFPLFPENRRQGLSHEKTLHLHSN